MTSVSAPPRRIGLLSNPNSRRNRLYGDRIDTIVAKHPAIDHHVTESADAIGPALHAFAASGVNVLAINGGDGTSARIFAELLEHPPFARMPDIVLLPGGTTNMNAGDIGLRGSLVGCVRRMVDWLDNPDRAVHCEARPVLRASGDLDGQPAYGMFFGAGTIISGIEYCKTRVHTRGIRDELGPGLVALRTLWGMARGEAYFSTPTDTRIELDGQPDARTRPMVQLIISSLERLFLGLYPFWGREPGALHCTWIEKPTRRVLRAFPSMMRGKPNRHASAENGYFSHNADRIQLWLDGLFTLDGEMYRASREHGPVTVTNGGNLNFIRLD